MAKNLITTHELAGTRVVGGKSGTRRIGKLRSFVFHPSEKRCIGFIVKRPDFLWMFKRKDKFVSIDGYDMVDGRVCIRDSSDATDKAALKALGVKWDDCVLWIGMPLMTENQTNLGVVGSVTFNRLTGKIESLQSSAGATSNALLGKREIPSDLIMGFKRGIGAALAQVGQEGREIDETMIGAILVSDEVLDIVAEGGLAEKAGKATAVVADKAGKATAKASEKASVVAKKTGKAVNKGAYATGKQISKTKGMFSAFKEEYDKARSDDEQ